MNRFGLMVLLTGLSMFCAALAVPITCIGVGNGVVLHNANYLFGSLATGITLAALSLVLWKVSAPLARE